MMLAFFKSRSPRHRATRAGMSHTLTPREAVARHLFGEAVNWSSLDMADYDHSAALQADWLAEADRRIDPDHDIREWFGYTLVEWNALPAIVNVDKREQFFSVHGLAS